MTYDLVAHLHRQRAFSERAFGPGSRANGALDHIAKELREIAAHPADLEEWIDVVLLALDGAWRAGYPLRPLPPSRRPSGPKTNAGPGRTGVMPHWITRLSMLGRQRPMAWRPCVEKAIRSGHPGRARRDSDSRGLRAGAYAHEALCAGFGRRRWSRARDPDSGTSRGHVMMHRFDIIAFIIQGLTIFQNVMVYNPTFTVKGGRIAALHG